jgi:uncharacterized protein YjcR
MMHDDTQAYLTTEQLAKRYGLKPATIKGWRIRKQGPTWYQVPRIGLSRRQARTRYRLADVLAWEQSTNITPIN